LMHKGFPPSPAWSKARERTAILPS
jgi:hypothetical protein